jgi:hypothetical protein
MQTWSYCHYLLHCWQKRWILLATSTSVVTLCAWQTLCLLK